MRYTTRKESCYSSGCYVASTEVDCMAITLTQMSSEQYAQKVINGELTSRQR
jgi:hypothetical protein